MTSESIDNQFQYQIQTLEIENNQLKQEIHQLKNQLQTIQESLSKCMKKEDVIQLIQMEYLKRKKSHSLGMTPTQMDIINEWTGLQINEVVFDSKKDNWTKDSSVFNEKIFGKKQLTFLIEDKYGQKFGYYLNTSIDQNGGKADEKSFHFNLDSKGRLSSPMKFEIRKAKFCGYGLYEHSADRLIDIGDIRLYKQHQKSQSFCVQTNYYFNYHGIENALCGKEYSIHCSDCFIPQRIIVIQMK